MIDDKEYILTKEDYIMLYNGDCVFKIMEFDFWPREGFWILGLNFFHNYYVVFRCGELIDRDC